MTPPPIREAEFAALDTSDEEDIKRRFGGYVRSLHCYLNEIPCLRDVQKVRRRWKSKLAFPTAFGTFAPDFKHWHTFHHGGRNEAQFNLGFYPTHVRVGLGFEFSQKKGGEPTIVQLAYSCFAKRVHSDPARFRRMVEAHHLEIELQDGEGQPLQFIPGPGVTDWLLHPPQLPAWLFVGRLLRRTQDAAILDSGPALGHEIQSVLCGFRPLWQETQELAALHS